MADRWKEMGFDDEEEEEEKEEEESPEVLKKKLEELEKKLAENNDIMDKLLKEKEQSPEEEEEEEKKEEKETPPEDPFQRLAETPFVQGLISKTRKDATTTIMGDDEVLQAHSKEIEEFVSRLTPDQLMDEKSLESVRNYFRGSYVDEYRGKTLDTRSSRGGEDEPPEKSPMSLTERQKKILEQRYGPGHEATLRAIIDRTKKGGR